MEYKGTLSLPSRHLVMTDPCYIDDKSLEEIKTGKNGLHLIFTVPGDAEVFYTIAEGRTSQVVLFFNGHGSLESLREAGEMTLGVDSGQMSYCDKEILTSEWIEEEYDIKQTYRNSVDGRTLTYMVDFPHYAAPIASEGGKTMNELGTTGEWTKLPYSGPINVSYNGMCHCHDEENLGEVNSSILVSDSGYGDGQYAVSIYLEKDGLIGALRIDFIGDDEDDEEDWEEEEEYEED